jgi:hypothetical protein
MERFLSPLRPAKLFASPTLFFSWSLFAECRCRNRSPSEPKLELLSWSHQRVVSGSLGRLCLQVGRLERVSASLRCCGRMEERCRHAPHHWWFQQLQAQWKCSACDRWLCDFRCERFTFRAFYRRMNPVCHLTRLTSPATRSFLALSCKKCDKSSRLGCRQWCGSGRARRPLRWSTPWGRSQ